MQPATQLSNEQKYSMSWEHLLARCIRFFGTGLITVFLAMPLTIYTAGLTDKNKLPCMNLLQILSTVLQLAVLLFFILNSNPQKNYY